MQYEKVTVKNASDLVWPFGGNGPHYLQNLVVSKYGRQIEVDPFPCTMVDEALVRSKIAEVEQKFPIGALVQWVIIPHEIKERCNAWAQRDWIYADQDNEDEMLIQKKHRIEAFVIMSGKRSNIHPAMTAFLVAHEYGHCVDYWVTSIMKEERQTKDEDVFRKEYAAMRGVVWNDRNVYGGGNYKDDIMEIIADDFRIVVAGQDADWYQHSVTHPLRDPAVVEYWHKLIEGYSFTNWWLPYQTSLAADKAVAVE